MSLLCRLRRAGCCTGRRQQTGGLFGAIATASWLVYRREVFGRGNVKLAAALGAWLTWREVLRGFAMAFIAGGAFGAAVMGYETRRGRWRWGSAGVPFELFLIAAAVALTAWAPLR
jgi:prepilin signal peptidase PulO-like enzyme (type II secretory pathway)